MNIPIGIPIDEKEYDKNVEEAKTKDLAYFWNNGAKPISTPKIVMPKFKKLEMKFILHFLNEHCERWDDIQVPATQENLWVVCEAEKDALGDEFTQLDIKNDILYTDNRSMIHYLCKTLQEEHKISDEELAEFSKSVIRT